MGDISVKSKGKFAIGLIFVLFIVFGCSKPEEIIEFEIYEGKSLRIGIIGEAPKVRENHVSFTPITFEELQDIDSISKYDAIFITKDNLVEADNSKYTNIYNSSPIPFLFIETPSYVPLVREYIDFEDYPDGDSGAYAYLIDGKSEKYWGYGLYNDEVNEQNIQSAYSRIFKTIEEISSSTKGRNS